MKTKINWKVRLENPMFYIQLGAAFLLPILGYMGLSGSDITTWSTLFETIGAALSNPYCLMMAVVSVYNVIVDTSSRGVGDDQATLDKTKL